jgi:2-polyprenyl-6-methoxyphenol hydroxylase-like FAD-dependent oxidoreductase
MSIFLDLLAQPKSFLLAASTSLIIGFFLLYGVRQFLTNYKSRRIEYTIDDNTDLKDVVIIGGGISGLSTAINLQKMSILNNIVVLERCSKVYSQPKNKKKDEVYSNHNFSVETLSSKSKEILCQFGVWDILQNTNKLIRISSEKIKSPTNFWTEHFLSNPVYLAKRSSILSSLVSVLDTSRVRIQWNNECQSLKFVPEKGYWEINYTPIG